MHRACRNTDLVIQPKGGSSMSGGPSVNSGNWDNRSGGYDRNWRPPSPDLPPGGCLVMSLFLVFNPFVLFYLGDRFDIHYLLVVTLIIAWLGYVAYWVFDESPIPLVLAIIAEAILLWSHFG